MTAAFGSSVVARVLWVDQGPRHDRLVARAGATDGEGPAVIRVAPLLLSADDVAGAHELYVGDVLIVATAGGVVELEIRIASRWSFAGHRVRQEADSASDTIADQLVGDVRAILPKAGESEDLAHNATRYAKAVCEVSRNTVAILRDIRYGLERVLAAESIDDTADEALTGIVSSLLMLNILCGRAEDRARDASREGLWSYLDDSEAYHAYRRLRDPALIGDHEPATGAMRSWMRLHDNAIRHCDAMADLLSKESAALIGLLEAASSISSSRDADAQTRLNLLIALLSLGLGVPALILALYGAQLLLPLETIRQRVAFAPIAFTLLVSALLALVFAPRGKVRRIWILAALAVLAVLAMLVFGANILVENAVAL